jgi:hypothetical protein
VPAAPEVKGPGKAVPGEGAGYHYFRFGGRYGFVTSAGKVAIPPTFLSADNFVKQGVARASEATGTGLLDARGAWVVLPLLKDVRPEEGEGADGYVAVNYSWSGRLGPDAAWQVQPRFQALESLGHGYYAYGFRGKIGLIGPGGAFVTGLSFDKLGKVHPRPDGTFLMAFTLDGKEGILDQAGKVIISPRFDSISPGFDENGRYIMSVGDKYGVLDVSDRWIIEPKYFKIEWHEKEGRFWVMENKFITSYFYHDRDGKRIGPIPKEAVWADIEGRPLGLTGCFASEKPDVFGFCDKTGKDVIPHAYDAVWNFSAAAGLARVKKSSLYGYVDPKGKEVVPPSYDDAYDYDDSKRAVVMKAGAWGVLDETGKPVIPVELEAYPAPAGKNGYFVKKGGLWGIYSRDGKPVLAPELQETLPFREGTGLAWARKGGLWGLINESGKWQLKPVYDDIGPFTEGGLAPVILQGRFAVVDEKGATVARSVIECDREVIRDRSGAISWPPDFSCAGS